MDTTPVMEGGHTAGRLTAGFKKGLAGLGAVCVLLLCAGVRAWALEPPARETRTVSVMETVPYTVDYIDEPDYYRGYTQLVSEGTPGEREVTAQVIFEGGKMARVLSIKSEEKAKPVNQVVRRGVKLLRSETSDGSSWETSFARPLKKGRLSADFYDYRGHNGIDLAAPYGTPVHAAAAGRVSLSGWYGEYGRCVMIEHPDGSTTLYGHNSALTVRTGELVKQGQTIARVGSTGNSTGNHVHFEIRADGKYLDPMLYMDQ